MDSSDIKNVIIKSLNADADTRDIPGLLESEGVSYDFSNQFADRVLNKVFSSGFKLNRQFEFFKYMDFAFYRVAITGVAAIVILLISIFLMEGSLNLNSLLGVSDNYNESVVCLLTGN